MNTAMQEQKKTALRSIAGFLHQNKAKIQTALPRMGMTADRMIRITLNSLAKNKELMECTVDSLWESIIEASTYGWEIGGPVAHAYLVPYRDTKRNVREAVLVPGYRGLMDLARRSGQVANIAYGVVHQGDQFSVSEDPLHQMVSHKHSDDPKRHEQPITHVWAGYLLTNGSRVYCVMTAAEIDAHKQRYAKGHDRPDSAWKTNWDAMACKTVLKRPIMKGQVPIASEHQRMVLRDEVDGEVAASTITTVEPERLEFAPDALPTPTQDDVLGHEDDWTLFTLEADERMGAAKTLAKADEVVDQLNSEYAGSEPHERYIFEIGEKRREAVRATRGERSNKQ